jgi:hypothetical protein
MHATAPSSLDSAALSRRLGELVGDERELQVDFLLHLDEYDRRRAYVEEGYDSLWTYCQRALLLREGPAALRIAVMRLLRRFPVLAAPLRDGRLCMTTVRLLEPILTEQNAGDLMERASGKSKADVERLVASVQPRPMPKEGVRKLPDRSPAPPEAPLVLSIGGDAAPAEHRELPEAAPFPIAPPPEPTRSTTPTAKLRPVDADTHSLTVTVDAVFLADLEQLKSLVSHKIPSGNLGLVLREAVRCAIQQHGKRKGAVEPCRTVDRKAPPSETAMEPKKGRDAIPAAVKRRVWKRDQMRCTYVSPDGRRCESTWRLQFHHLEEHALGGPDTDDNLTLRCPPHNWYAAEQTFGREHMEQFRRSEPRMCKATDSRSSDGG